MTTTPYGGKTLYRLRSTVLCKAMADRPPSKLLPKVGAFTKRIDRALPGKHTFMLYDKITKPEARMLAQLRTGMIRLNSYLHRIGLRDSPTCQCGHATETIDHFLFSCIKWMNVCTETRFYVTRIVNEATSLTIWEARGRPIRTIGRRTSKPPSRQSDILLLQGGWRTRHNAVVTTTQTSLN